MGLLQVATSTVTSAVSSVTLTGIDSDDVYKVVISKCVPATDTVFLSLRATESGTPNTTANYDGAGKLLRSDTTFSNSNDTNSTSLFLLGNNTGTGTGEQINLINYIFNANNSGEYTFFTTENNFLDNAGNLNGQQGGGVFTVASSVNGVQYFFSSGNIASGTFTLYKVT
tara:strand:+ start:286 stop:795 length:510 start_codon:yes stop_codon:yes gene_type:complete